MKKILSFLLLMCSFFLCGCNSSEYKQTVSLLEDSKYESALKIFEELAQKKL